MTFVNSVPATRVGMPRIAAKQVSNSHGTIPVVLLRQPDETQRHQPHIAGTSEPACQRDDVAGGIVAAQLRDHDHVGRPAAVIDHPFAQYRLIDVGSSLEGSEQIVWGLPAISAAVPGDPRRS